MPRPKLAAPPQERANLNHEVIAADGAAVDADSARRMEILERFGDGQAFELVRVVNEARWYVAQTANGMLETGKRLILIKENVDHGDFVKIVEELGLTARAAQKMMQAALKFLLPGRDNQKLLSLQPSKLLELAILDDDNIKELAKGKTVAGLDLDEIETLTFRELRDRLREVKGQLEAKDRVIASKNKKLDEIDERNAKKAPYELQFEKALGDIGSSFDKLQLACADLARLAESIPDLEFEGVDRQNDVLTLQAQLAVQFHERSALALDQAIGLWIGARADFIEALLGVAKKKLPEDIKAKLFGETP